MTFSSKKHGKYEICLKINDPVSGSDFRMWIRIHEKNLMQIHVEPDPK
jgi:hypothetical protein